MKKFLSFVLPLLLANAAFASVTMSFTFVNHTPFAIHTPTGHGGNILAGGVVISGIIGLDVAAGGSVTVGGWNGYPNSQTLGCAVAFWDGTSYITPADFGSTSTPTSTPASPATTGSATFDFYYTGTNAPPACTTNMTFNVKNTSNVYKNYAITYSSSVSDGSYQMLKVLTLAPNTSGSVSKLVDCTNVSLVKLYTADAGGTVTSVGGDNFYSGTFADTGAVPTGSGGSFTSLGSTAPVPSYNPTNAFSTGTNSPIIFQSTNNQQSTEQGFGAIYTLNQNLGNQAHTDAQAVQDAIRSIAVTNIGSAGVSNVNVQNWPSAWSNRLSEISSNSTLANQYLGIIASNTYALGTNRIGTSTNLSQTNSAASLMTSLIPSTATNAAAAQSSAETAEGDYGVAGLLGELVPSLPEASPSAPDMTIAFVGQTIDLDPNHLVPSASVVSLVGWRIILTLGFLTSISGLFWKTIQVKASQSTGGVPDLEVEASGEAATFGGGLGGNFIGVLVALTVPLAFVTLFVVAMTYIFSFVGLNISEAMDTSAWADSLGAIGWYLLASFFPVSYFFSLVTTRIVLSFTLGKLVSIASDAARWLWGK